MSKFHFLLKASVCLGVIGALWACGSSGETTASKQGTAQKLYTQDPEPPKPRFPKPKYVRGIYLTAWSAGSTRKMEKMMALLDKTELNAVVIDVRDSGQNYWKMGVELSEKSGAEHVAVAKPERLFATLEKHKVFPIARVACFRDNYVTRKFPERAVQDKTGKPWRDRAGNSWLDPYNQKNWEYIGSIIDFALKQGFPEIQLDYVRFPSEGKSSTQVFPAKKGYPDQKALPEDVIAKFAQTMRDRVHAQNAEITADIFGIISSGSADQGIGQRLEKIYEPFDTICPMVYPSHFAKGEYGIANPNSSPYAIILKSLRDYQRKLPKTKVRPWLQDFSLGVKYGKAEVQAQIKASYETGYREYLLWNAGNHYTTEAVIDTSNLVPPAKKTASKEPVPTQEVPKSNK